MAARRSRKRPHLGRAAAAQAVAQPAPLPKGPVQMMTTAAQAVPSLALTEAQLPAATLLSFAALPLAMAPLPAVDLPPPAVPLLATVLAAAAAAAAGFAVAAALRRLRLLLRRRRLRWWQLSWRLGRLSWWQRWLGLAGRYQAANEW